MIGDVLSALQALPWWLTLILVHIVWTIHEVRTTIYRRLEILRKADRLLEKNLEIVEEALRRVPGGLARIQQARMHVEAERAITGRDGGDES